MEKYKLRITSSFERDFRKLDVHTKRRLDPVIRKMENDPFLGKPLRGELSGKWSLRVGDYRVIYIVDEQEKRVILYSAKHRKKAYK